MSDKLKLVKINDREYVNPAFVLRVYLYSDTRKVGVDLLNGDFAMEFKSDFSLEETIKLLTE
jgi:hypothetical protein